MSKNVFRWCLLCLLLAAGALSSALMNWDTNPMPPIGGGGYDLSDFVYSWALVLLSGGASVISLVVGLNVDDRPASHRAFVFAAIALALLAIAATMYGDNLR